MKRMTIILLSAVSLVFMSCLRRELVDVSNTHYVRVYVDEDIRNVTTGIFNEDHVTPPYQSPDLLRLVLSDPQTGNIKAERFLRTRKEDERGVYYEGYIVCNPGRYNMIAYNFDTEVCIVKNYNDYYNSKVYTNEIATHLMSRVSTKTGENTRERIVYSPDHFFVANYRDVYIPYLNEVDTLKTAENDFFVAKNIVKSFYVQVKVKGIQYATSSVGLISGLAGSAWVGKGAIDEQDPVTVYFEMQPGKDLILSDEDEDLVGFMYATFGTFGKIPESGSQLSITFDFLTTHGGAYTHTVDITDKLNSSQAQEQHWIILNEPIDLPEPEPGGGGGFQPSVGEWEEVETEIII